ncbi:MAG TPA: hypothetical protein VGX91_11910 [Candidatus Cybelea sp.]|jgi:hypothetical protein|nr:hypothetical protein [Candidatus Cybelea sp.]
MNQLAPGARAAALLAVVSLAASPLGGCSAASALPSARAVGSQVPAMGSPAQNVEPDTKKQLLFVSDNANDKVFVYNAASKTQNPPPLRTITAGIKGPNGITTDKSGNLYVTNFLSDTVTIYAPNASTPKTTISNGLSGPFDVKVDGFGNIYVANDPLSGTAFIEEYAQGSSTPTNTWSVPSAGMVVTGIALLNPTLQNETSIYATEFVQNSSTGAVGGMLTCYPNGSTCSQVGGVTFGQTGGVAVEESPGEKKPFEYLAVDQYVPGVDILSPGQSSGQIVTGGTPEFVALDAKANQLFVADRFYGRVVEYSFPGGKQLNAFTPTGDTQIYGVATSPAGTYR